MTPKPTWMFDEADLRQSIFSPSDFTTGAQSATSVARDGGMFQDLD
jgi:hypothetical protein